MERQNPQSEVETEFPTTQEQPPGSREDDAAVAVMDQPAAQDSGPPEAEVEPETKGSEAPRPERGATRQHRRQTEMAATSPEPEKTQKQDTRPTIELYLHGGPTGPGHWPAGSWERDGLRIVAKHLHVEVRGRNRNDKWGRLYTVQGAEQNLKRLERMWPELYAEMIAAAQNYWRSNQGTSTWNPTQNAYNMGLVMALADALGISHEPSRLPRDEISYIYDAGYEFGHSLFASKFGGKAEAKPHPKKAPQKSAKRPAKAKVQPVRPYLVESPREEEETEEVREPVTVS